MKSLRLASLALVLPAAAVVLPSQAQAIGFGVEGGGTFTQVGSPTSGSNNIWTLSGGIIIDNQFPIAILFLDLWADVQTPLRLETGGAAPAKYVPIDLGLRLGLNLGLLQPYVGVLGQLAVNTDSGGGPALNSPLWGLGGDLGLDIAIFVLRLGLELRAVSTVTPIVSDPLVADEGNAIEFQALLSVRLSF